jgi:dTDP-4-dehydrorhamnose reductase
MRIVIFGAYGQVGEALTRTLAADTLVAVDRSMADLQDSAAIQRVLSSHRPEVIINAAAYTAVDRAETDRDSAFAVNVIAPEVMAEWAYAHNALLVHYSTDYVFDGSGSMARDEAAPTQPLSVYGATKLAGEERIQRSGCQHLILRTSWVYAARGHNFLRTMLRFAAERDALSVVDDQVGVPTSAAWLAEVTAQVIPQALANPALRGLYHCVPQGETTWFQFARLAIAEARRLGLPVRVAPEAIRAIATADYPTPAQRPLNSRLSTQMLQQAFGIVPPDWHIAVRETVAQIARESALQNDEQ